MAKLEPIVLPRPNPSPLPWSVPAEGSGLWISGISLAVAVGVYLLLRSRRKPVLDQKREALPEPEPSLTELALRVRERLSKLLDERSTALTTEEIAQSPLLPERFGPEETDQLVAFLQQADRNRFSGDTPPIDPELERWARQFVRSGGGEASPMSTMTGK